MQRVFSAKWTPDNKYILSGSDDGNIRLWRAQASKREGIKRIKRHRHIPKVVKKAGEIKNEELKAIKRKEENERKHTKAQFKKRRNEREKMVLAAEK
ncbi:putative protein sof1 [Glarea lozoyensis 74030]|uniref:Sof1-like protein domain-containing protein n=1 Tax=Glarea lozoyensis (strain ATCC 74030 / MF5533) TaxID=1104152 RepID=H0EDB5_GLAL7|nr:putative protein sof1 [Glarea lozoyensis 74030]